MQDLRSEIASRDLRIEQLEDALAQKASTIAEAESQNKRLCKRNAELRAGTIKEYEAQQEWLKKVNERLRDKIAQSNTKLEEEEEANEQHHSDLNHCNARISELLIKSDNLETDVKRLTLRDRCNGDALHALRRIITERDDEIEGLRDSNKKLIGKLSERTQQLEVEEIEHKETVQELNDARLRQTIIDEQRQEIEDLQASNELLTIELNEQLQEQCRLHDREQIATKELLVLRGDLNAVIDAQRKHTQKITQELTDTCLALIDSKERLTEVRSRMNAVIDDQRKQIQYLRTQLA